MNQLNLPSPAKLNLMLHITGQRTDGYHELQTLFQLLDYGDTLHIQRREDSSIQVSPQIDGLAQEDNLIYKAARLLQQHCQCELGADIQLQKILPMGGGIGGGSSNAATTLLGLNELWQLNLSLNELAELGLQLGADVPVFVKGHSAWAEGVGEQLQAVDIPETWYFVVKPDCHVSTKEIFSHKQLTRDTSPITIAAVFEQGLRNDCEAVVRELYPEVDSAIKWLSKHSPDNSPARLTGTGACVFSCFPDQQSAQHLLQHMPVGLQGFVAKGVNISPVHRSLNLL